MRRRWLAAAVAVAAAAVLGAGWWWQRARGGGEEETRAVIVGAGQSFPSDLRLEAGRRYRLAFTALDRPYRLTVPALGLDVEARPGALTEVRLQPKRPGTYRAATGEAAPFAITVEPAGGEGRGTQGQGAGRGAAFQVALVATRERFVPDRIEVPQGAVLELGGTSLGREITWLLVGSGLQLPFRSGQLTTARFAVTEPGDYAFGCVGCDLERPTGRLAVRPAGGGQGLGPYTGAKAPDFALEALGGGTLRLSSLKGRIVVLNFWATWCDPCRQEMPELERYWRAHRDEVTVLGVNMGEGPEKVQPFVRALDITFPVVLDRQQKVARQYQVVAIPSTYVIDREGVVRAKYLGPMDGRLIEQLVRQARR